MTDDLTPWFYDERFLQEVIRLGLAAILEQGTSNNEGLANYFLDKRFEIDAKIIVERLKRD